MAAGDIGSVIDTLIFDATFGDTPEIIHVSGDVYAIAYTDTAGDGILVTVSIDADGNIGASIIDSLEFNDDSGLTPSILYVGTTYYAIAHAMTGVGGVVKTMSIAPDGTIAPATFDVLTFIAATCREPFLYHIIGEMLAVVYRGPDDDGWICTFPCDNTGHVPSNIVDSLEYDTVRAFEPKLVQVSALIFAIVYRGTDNHGFIKTLAIDAAGDIGSSVIDSFEFDDGSCYVPDIIKVADGIFAIAYLGPDNDGFVVTVAIDSGGNITAGVIDTLEFETGGAGWPFICHIAGNIYSIAFAGPDSDGFLVTINIDPAGNIGGAVLDTLEFDEQNCHEPGMVRISENMFAIAYQGFGDAGVLKTMGVQEPVTGSQHLLLMGVG